MMNTCPYCGGPVPSHGTCCRVPDDLDRFERVFERLTVQHDNEFLRENLLRYLVAYGRRAEDELNALIQPFRGGEKSAISGAW